MPTYYCICPYCKQVFPCEAGQKDVTCRFCRRRILNPRAHPAQYSNKPRPPFFRKKRKSPYENDTTRLRRRPRKEIYRPNPGRTITSPANFRMLEQPTPTLLQPEPSDTQPIETEMGKMEQISQGLDEFINFIEKNIVFIAIGLMTLAIAGGIISANTSSGTSGSSSGSSSSDLCAEFYSKIKSVRGCTYSSGTSTKPGWLWCYTTPYGGTEGQGWVPEECY